MGERCGNCDEPIMRADLTMRGRRGAWVHESTKRRMCVGTPERFAAPPSSEGGEGP